MLKGKNYHDIDMRLSCICAFVNRTTGYTEHEELTQVISLGSKVVVQMYVRCEAVEEHLRFGWCN